MKLFPIILLSYLLGSFPFGYWLGLLRGKNILQEGSCSIGTTNVIRVVGKPWGLLTLLLDLAKGYLAVYLAAVCLPANPLAVILAGAVVLIGHSKSVWINFRGGKSAATGIGIVLFLNWQIFLIIAVVVFVVRQLSGYQSLATIVGVLLIVVLFCLYREPVEYILLVAFGATWILWKHLPNIQRLLRGEELKITGKRG